MDNPKEVQLQIQIDDPVAQGAYVNMAMVNHNETEFVLDFMYLQPQQPVAKVRSRIITSPRHAKRFLMALSEQLARYEQRFGTLDVRPPAAPMPGTPSGGPVH